MIKKLLLALIIPVLGSHAASLKWTNPIDPTGVVKYNLYVKTNSVTTTNFYKLGSVNHPTNTFPFSLPAGETYSFYATSENNQLLESDPSNIATYFTPLGVPPENVISTVSINSYSPSLKVWSGVTLTWTNVDKVKYGFTNYTVNVVSPTSTNQYITVNNTITINSLTLNNYIISVSSSNSLGSSVISSKSTWYLFKTNPKKVEFLQAE